MLIRYTKYLLALCLIFAAFPGMANNQPSLFTDGQDYIKLPEQLRRDPDIAQLLMNDPTKVQVLFFFSYGCPACARFDPPFEKWIAKQKTNKLIIYRFPVVFKEEWAPLARLYFVMKYLDPKQSLDEKIFEEIHQKNLQLWQEPIMKEFFIENGYSAKDFEQAFNSFSVNREIKQTEELSKAYKISQTPTIIINGPIDSYQLNLDKAGNDAEKFFKILDFLIAKETKLLN